MKKLAAILLALAMLFTLAACGEKDNDSDPNLGRYEGTTIEAMGVTMNFSDIYEGENYEYGYIKNPGELQYLIDNPARYIKEVLEDEEA